MVDLSAKMFSPKTCPDLIAQHKPRSTQRQLEHGEGRQVRLSVTLGMLLNCPHLKIEDTLRWSIYEN